MAEYTHTHTHSCKRPGSARPSQPRLCVHLNTAFQRFGQYIHVPEAGRDPVPQTPYFLHWSFPIPSPFPKALESELKGLRFWQVPQRRLKRDTCPVDGGGAKDLGLLGLPWWLSGKEFTCKAQDTGLTPGSRRSLEEGTATHSSILAWSIPWTEEPGGLRSMRSHRVRHDWSDLARMHTHRRSPSHTWKRPVTQPTDSGSGKNRRHPCLTTSR